jgi:hypothetical protein
MKLNNTDLSPNARNIITNDLSKSRKASKEVKNFVKDSIEVARQIKRRNK